MTKQGWLLQEKWHYICNAIVTGFEPDLSIFETSFEDMTDFDELSERDVIMIDVMYGGAAMHNANYRHKYGID